MNSSCAAKKIFMFNIHDTIQYSCKQKKTESDLDEIKNSPQNTEN